MPIGTSFGALSGNDGPETFISEPSLSKTTGKSTVYLSRRFEARDGSLIGFVVSTIEIEFFEQFYAKLPLTGAGSFTLHRRDGMLIARYPHADPGLARITQERRISTGCSTRSTMARPGLPVCSMIRTA